MAITILTLDKGSTGPFTVTVPFSKLGASGLAPYHGVGGALYFYGKLSKTDPDTAAVTGGPGAIFKKTLASGISVIADGDDVSVNGVVSITLDPADTNGLPDLNGAVTIYCSLKGNDGSGHDYTLVGDIRLVVGMQSTSKVS